MTKKLWGGRFAADTSKLMEQFNGSITFDKRLYKEDIRGSIAHAKMLAKQKIISAKDFAAIQKGLLSILKDIDAGKFDFKLSLEDIHMNIEAELTKRIGPAGARLHSARSRNDQVAVDMHMYAKKEAAEIAGLIFNLQMTVLALAQKNKDVVMPGYTHLQRAQPVTFAHHMLAYFNMLCRDFERAETAFDAADICPLGAGAIAGTTLPIDRAFTAKELNFGKVYSNSMDAVSDRDYVVEFLAFLSILMMHLSRLSEELIIWSSTEFGFIELSDAYATGSSMMPQKKNPDAAELTRGKTGRVYGSLLSMLTTLKGLPLTYNKDMQEDKEGFFDAIDTAKNCLLVFEGMLSTIKINKEKMAGAFKKDFSNATDLADYLVKKGLPFREAHEVTGKAVAYAIKKNCALLDLSLEEFKALSPLFAKDIYGEISIDTCVSKRNSYGGTSFKQTAVQLKFAAEVVKKEAAQLKDLKDNI